MSQDRGHGHGHGPGPEGGQHDGHDQAHDHEGLGDLLDLDAEVLAVSLAAVRQDIERLADGPVRSILDVGAGTGTGTLGLLQHFTDAHAWAVDESPEMLDRLSGRLAELGLADRVSTVRANLDESVPDVEPVDLVWASASLHHLANPERTLAELAMVIRPGGLMAVVEMSGFPRFVPDDAPGGEAEARAHALLAADRVVDMPSMGSDWGTRLTGIGLTIEVERPIRTDIAAPTSDVVGRYAAGSLARVFGAVSDRLEPADRAMLGSLLDGGANDVRTRSDLRVTNERQLWIARRSPATA